MVIINYGQKLVQSSLWSRESSTLFFYRWRLFLRPSSLPRDFTPYFGRFKHRTLTMQTYRIVIGMVWALAVLVSALFNALFNLISFKHSVYIWTPYTLILILVMCGCHIGIWRKFRHGRVASQQESKALQSKRLTKNLMFVSTLALLPWTIIIAYNCFELFIRINFLDTFEIF